MNLFLFVLAAVGGYVAAVFTWDKLHTLFVGAQAKAQALRLKAIAIENDAKNIVGK